MQVHGKEADPFFEEDLEAARALVESADGAELFLYPGEEHLFADSSLPAYDAAAAKLLTERVLAFLERARARWTTTYTIKALDETTWDAFAALVEENNGVFGGCWCIGFHPEGGDRETTPALNRQRKLERVQEGTTHAALVFDGDDCVGWCQFGAPDEVPRIKSRAAYEKGATTHRIGGSPATSWARGTGARAWRPRRLAGALDLIARLGGGTVEGYPEGAGSVPAGLPLQRRALDLRAARLHAGPEDRQAPLGGDEGRRAN